MRIVFMGTAEFGIPTLRILHDKHDIAAVVTGRDTPKGRGRKLQPSPVKITATELGLDILTPGELNDPEFIDRLREYKADLFYVVAFRILPESVFSIPPPPWLHHPNRLPRNPGRSPGRPVS